MKRHVPLIWSALILPGYFSVARPRNALDKPNFVVLFVDDLGYGDLGFTGHPTASTPNLDNLARSGRILTTWYSGCPVCSGSRAALMTGRQYPRTGVPGVFGSTENVGLPLNETTVAEMLKTVGYATGVVGKWHLGQRDVYLPGNRGFDYYLGIPYSDDMGNGITSPCKGNSFSMEGIKAMLSDDGPHDLLRLYEEMGFTHKAHDQTNSENGWGENDPASLYLPLVYQELNHTHVIEQPLDFTHLAEKYSAFAKNFIQKHKDEPFFLYVPFSHVHTTSNTQPNKQFAGCRFRNSTKNGAFGDALAEADWISGNIVKALRDLDLEENTLVLFASDNGPWLIMGDSAGTAGLLTGRYAGYWNTGKGTTWEGGIRMPAFARWKGQIEPFSRSSEIVSSMDVFPTLAALAGAPLPKDRVYDGRNMAEVLLSENGRSKHDFLFIYSVCRGPQYEITAVRHGAYKAHWCTRPGLGGSRDQIKEYRIYPILFHVERDPSEAHPVSPGDVLPTDPEHANAMKRILKAYAMEKATFEYGTLKPEPDGPGEGPGKYGVCCDRAKSCNCSENTGFDASGIFTIGTRGHHDKFHDVLGEDQPSPPTQIQARLNGIML